jgi:hypothetical protein
LKSPAKYPTTHGFPKCVFSEELELSSSLDNARLYICNTALIVVSTMFRDMLKRNYNNDFWD